MVTRAVSHGLKRVLGRLFMINVKGTNVKARKIPRRTLVSAWNLLTKEPFPNVAAFQLKDRDFDNVIELMKCVNDERREMEEWGRVLSTRGTDACVYNADESTGIDYIILIRENLYHKLRDVLRHELSHIARGDL